MDQNLNNALIRAGEILSPPGDKSLIVDDFLLNLPLKERSEQLELNSDNLDSLKRRVAIAILAFGDNDSRISAWLGRELGELRNDPEVIRAIKDGACLTQAEIAARLSIIADTANQDKDRLTALKLLMEYRGIAAPEGGSRSFSRTIMRFKKS